MNSYIVSVILYFVPPPSPVTPFSLISTDHIAVSGTIYAWSCLTAFVLIAFLGLNLLSRDIHMVSSFRPWVKCQQLREDFPDHPKPIITQPFSVLLFYSTYHCLTLYYEFVYYLVYICIKFKCLTARYFNYLSLLLKIMPGTD